MTKVSPKIVAVLAVIALIYALFDNFNKEVIIGSLLTLILSIGIIINK